MVIPVTIKGSTEGERGSEIQVSEIDSGDNRETSKKMFLIYMFGICSFRLWVSFYFLMEIIFSSYKL